jgi:hypothetical protein
LYRRRINVVHKQAGCWLVANFSVADDDDDDDDGDNDDSDDNDDNDDGDDEGRQGCVGASEQVSE